MEISQAKARDAFEKFQHMKARMRSLRAESEAAIGRAKLSVEVLGGAAAAGYLNQKQGTGGKPWQLMGFDADMAIGLLGVGAAMVGVAGKYDEDILGIGLGFGASWAVREGQALATATPATATTTQAAGAIPAGQFVGALPAGQFTGAINAAGHWHPANQNTGAIPAGQYTGAQRADGQWIHGQLYSTGA